MALAIPPIRQDNGDHGKTTVKYDQITSGASSDAER